MEKLLGPEIFKQPLHIVLTFFGISNSAVTLFLLLLFSLVIVNEPIMYLFRKGHKTAYEKFETRHFWETLAIIPFMVVPLLWGMYKYGVFTLNASGSINFEMHVFQFALMIVLHDMYFYWCHRLMHLRAFWKIHSIHHQAKEPTIVSSHLFHYLETFVNYSFMIWFVLLWSKVFGTVYYIPALVFVLYTIVWNIYGHGKRNLLPDRITRSYLGHFIVWPRYHLEHHRQGYGNFAFFFTFWDDIFGTRLDIDNSLAKK